jgi:hypothetical protein
MKFHLLLRAAVIFSTATYAGSLYAQGATAGNPVYANTSPYSVKCDNVTDDTTAINNVLSSASGREIIFPAGICRYSGGGVLGAGTTIVGSGRNSTVIKAIQPSATLFVARGEGSGLRNIKFVAGVTQTGGHYVVLGDINALGGFESFIEDFAMSGDYNGILMNGSAARIRHGRFQQGATGAIRIRAEGGDNSQVIDDILMGAQDTSLGDTAAGIRVRGSAALIINNTSVLKQGIGLLVDPYIDTLTPAPGTDQGSVHSLVVNNSFFDGSSHQGVLINPTSNASVVKVRFSNVWIGSSQGDGLAIVNSSSGKISGISLVNPHILLQVAASGVTTSGTITDFSITGGEISANYYGLYFGSGITGVRITNSAIGQAAAENGNTVYGMVINSGVDYITLANNDFRGNGTGAVANSTPGANQYFKNNIGLAAAGPL